MMRLNYRLCMSTDLDWPRNKSCQTCGDIVCSQMFNMLKPTALWVSPLSVSGVCESRRLRNQRQCVNPLIRRSRETLLAAIC